MLLDQRQCYLLGDGKQIDEKYDWPDLPRTRTVVVQQRQTRGQQKDAHEREGDQAQLASADRVDDEQGGDCTVSQILTFFRPCAA